MRKLPRPTRSAALLMLLAMILELLGRVINSTGVTIAAAAAVGAVISDALLTPGVRIGTVRRSAPARLAVGVPAPLQITVAAHTRRRLGSRRPVVVLDAPAGLPPGRVVTPRLAAGQHAVAERLTTPTRRGRWTGGGSITIEAFSPLGGFVRRSRFAVDGSVVVHPAPARPLRLPDAAAGDVDGASASARVGPGADIYGIREWRSGDPTSTIHWRTSARRNQLVVLEHERPGRPALVVVVDTTTEDDAWEAGLARAAATAVHAARSGQVVVLVAGTSASTLSRPRDLLDWFAAVEPATAPAATAVVRALRDVRGGATVVWVGKGAAPAYLINAARSAGTAAVLVTGDSAAGESSS